MDAEDLLTLIDAVCSETGASVRSLPAILCLAGLARPYVAGIPVFGSASDHAESLFEHCMLLRPLTEANDVLAVVLGAAVAELEQW